MSRWLEDAGATAGATVIAAARAEAWRTAFCIATDATGIRVVPEPREDGQRQACHRGHYFVQIADRDHVFGGLSRDELAAYLAHLLRLAGTELPLFQPAALEAIHHATNGLPRKVNLLAHHALIAAALANARAVSAEHVQAALPETS